MWTGGACGDGPDQAIRSDPARGIVALRSSRIRAKRAASGPPSVRVANSHQASNREELRVTFDGVAELYDRARIGYPAALLDDVAALGPRMLEIGPGTGQATRDLVARGADVTAVELGPNLAAIARRNVPQATIVIADFDTWELEQADFDAVVSFTAFHWLDPDTKYAKVARLLRAGGALAVTEIEYVTVPGGDTFWADVRDDYEAVLPDVDFDLPPPEEAVGDLRAELEASGFFPEIEIRRHRWDVTFTVDEWIDILGTFSPNLAAGPAITEPLFARIRARLEARPDRSVTQHLLATLNLART
jgi:SAM-dependent methyltransferase